MNNFDTVARGTNDYCRPDWTEDCLKFHSVKRRVRTASVLQVRQPFFAISMENVGGMRSTYNR